MGNMRTGRSPGRISLPFRKGGFWRENMVIMGVKLKENLSFFLKLSVLLLSSAAFSAPKVARVPELAGKSIVFVERKQFPQNHHNTANIFQFGEINEDAWKACAGMSTMYMVDFDAKGEPSALKVLAHSKDGIVRDPEISYDAKKSCFQCGSDAATPTASMK